MSDTIGTAYVQVEPSFDGVVPQIDKEFGGAGVSGGKSFTSGFGTAMKGFGVATATAGAAIGAMGAKFVSATGDVAEYGDNIDKMSQKMGLTAEAYQEWDAVMKHSGTSMETMKASMKTLANAAERGYGAFREIGITEEMIANMSQQELFEATIAGLQQVENDTERTYYAGKLLGRGATELGALLNTSAEDTQAMRDRVRELGGVMSTDAVKASAAFQDQLQDMKTSFSGLSRNIMTQFLPDMTKVMSGLTEIFSGNSEEGLSQITEGINGVVQGITDALPEIAKTATDIVKALASAIIDNLPILIETGMEILKDLCQYILDNLPELIQVGLEIVLELATGIAESLPELIPAMVDTILAIVDYLLDNIDLLVDASIAIITGLAEGIINALPKLIEKAPEIIIKLVEALIRNVPKILKAAVELITMFIKGIVDSWKKIIDIGRQIIDKVKEGIKEKIEGAKQWGKDLIKNFVDGIKGKWEDLKDGVKGVASTIKDYLGFSEPEEGPLSNFHTFAPDMMKLFAQGITDNANLVKDALTNSTAGLMNAAIDPNFAQNVNMQVANAGANIEMAIYNLLSTYLPVIAEGNDGNIVVNIDRDKLFEIIRLRNYEYKQQYGHSAFY